MEKIRTKLYETYDPYSELDLLDEDLQGWDSINPLFLETIKEHRPKVIVEVGSWKGSSAIFMAHLCTQIYGNRNFEIVCIDTFSGSVEHWNRSAIVMSFKNGRPNIYDVFRSNVVRHGYQDVITPFPVDSVNGGLTLKYFGVEADMVYIDAGHDYHSVRMDCTLYSSMLRAGGILIGDDYFHPEVKRAVIETFGEDKIIDHTHKFLWIR